MDTINNAVENGKAEEVNFTEILVEFFVHKNETMAQLLERVYKLGQKSSEAILLEDNKNLEKLVASWKELCDARLKIIGDKDMALFRAQNENDKLQEDCAEYRLLVEEKKELIEEQRQEIKHLKIASECLRKSMVIWRDRCEEKNETIVSQRKIIQGLESVIRSAAPNVNKFDRLVNLTTKIDDLLKSFKPKSCY